MGSIRRTFLGVVAALSLSGPLAGPALAAGKTVGVSWRHFQEERWRIDEAGIKSVLEPGRLHLCQRRRAGRPAEAAHRRREPDRRAACDAPSSWPRTRKAIMPAFEQAKAEGIPVIAYDVPVDFADALFVSFDNVAVGRLMAEGHGQGHRPTATGC